MSRSRGRKQALAGRAAENRRLVREALGPGATARDVKRALADQSLAIGRDPEELKRLAGVCTNCGVSGHLKAECPDVSCFRCGASGHLQNRCPDRVRP